MTEQLIFGVGRLLCALPLADVLETVRPLPVQPLAGGAGALLGVAVIRGAAVPVLDTARVLGDPGAPPTRFVMASTRRGPVAFATGDVMGVRAIAPSTAGPPPAAGTLVSAVGVLDGRPLLFLQPDAALDAAVPHNAATDQAARHDIALAQSVERTPAPVQPSEHDAAPVRPLEHDPAPVQSSEHDPAPVQSLEHDAAPVQSLEHSHAPEQPAERVPLSGLAAEPVRATAQSAERNPGSTSAAERVALAEMAAGHDIVPGTLPEHGDAVGRVAEFDAVLGRGGGPFTGSGGSDGGGGRGGA